MNNTPAKNQQDTTQGITEAIRAIAESCHDDPQTTIRVLPTMPEFQYRHTCPKCGCHLATALWIEPDPYEPIARICLHCQHVYESARGEAV